MNNMIALCRIQMNKNEPSNKSIQCFANLITKRKKKKIALEIHEHSTEHMIKIQTSTRTLLHNPSTRDMQPSPQQGRILRRLRVLYNLSLHFEGCHQSAKVGIRRKVEYPI